MIRFLSMDFIGFFSAVVTDWVGLVSGGFSILLTIVGFYRNKKTARRFFWGAALLAFALASVRAWTTEHRKVLGQNAFLSAAIQPFYPTNPFPKNSPLEVNLVWENVGGSPATKPRKSGRIFILDGINNQAESRAIEDWKSYWTEALSGASIEEASDLFPHNPRSIQIEGPRLTAQTFSDVFEDKVKTIAVIGAVRFIDGQGMHEAHTCQWLRDVLPNRLVWEDCHTYTTQIDLK